MDLNFYNVDQICSAVDLRATTPVVNLSDVTFFTPFALVYLGMFLRYHNSYGKSFTVTPPTNQQARGYLARQNFWARFNFNPDAIKDESLLRRKTSTSLNDIIDVERQDEVGERIATQILGVLRTNGVKVPTGLIAELMCELVDNFAQHSERTLAAVAMQYYPNIRRVTLAIGDCGIGIRSSLSSNPQYSYLAGRPHYEAGLKSFEALVSRTGQGGTGLTEVRDEVINLNGYLTLSTGDGYVRIDGGKTTYGQMFYDMPGVQIALSFHERG